ncbi:hypothetical protein QBC39DRAFT_342880 [Podospora conica]|nr:hypothetical protein QBC39DRAFT_342880 [Schizothecium conicum]
MIVRRGHCWAFFRSRSLLFFSISCFFLFFFWLHGQQQGRGAGLSRRWVKYPLSESIGISGFLVVQLAPLFFEYAYAGTWQQALSGFEWFVEAIPSSGPPESCQAE